VEGSCEHGNEASGSDDHSSPSTAEIKTRGAIPPLPHTSPWIALN
jgi:hypothetical protein